MNDDEFMDAMMHEISGKADKKFKSTQDVADFLWLYYCAYMKAGFSEDKSFTLVGLMLDIMVSNGFKK